MLGSWESSAAAFRGLVLNFNTLDMFHPTSSSLSAPGCLFSLAWYKLLVEEADLKPQAAVSPVPRFILTNKKGACAQ